MNTERLEAIGNNLNTILDTLKKEIQIMENTVKEFSVALHYYAEALEDTN